jgi:hypothetical protein
MGAGIMFDNRIRRLFRVSKDARFRNFIKPRICAVQAKNCAVEFGSTLVESIRRTSTRSGNGEVLFF